MQLYTFVLAACPMLTGCSAIGYGVGSAIPKITTEPTLEVSRLKKGDHVSVGTIEGRVVEVRDGAIDVESNGRIERVPRAPDVWIKHKTGDYAVELLVVGVIVDVAAFVAVDVFLVASVVESGRVGRGITFF